MNPLVRDVAKSVAKFINKSWPDDKDYLFEILSIAEEYFWISGLFQGSTIFATVANDNGRIVTPHGYSILEGVAVNQKPQIIRDKNSYFHVNGPGPIGAEEINSCYCRGEISKTIYDLGEFPTLLGNQNSINGKTFKISVEPSGCEKGEVIITGLNECGHMIYTYFQNGYSNSDDDSSSGSCFCGESEIAEKQENGMDVIEGVSYSLTKPTMYENVTFSNVIAITKSNTLAPVNIYAVYDDGSRVLLSRMEPFQTESSYRIYNIEDKSANIVGLFRRSKPGRIVNETQRFIVNSEIATITMVEGVYEKHYTKDSQRGSIYIADAIAILKESYKSSQSNYKAEIQVSGREFSVKGIRR
jgi:hypothetical protein